MSLWVDLGSCSGGAWRIETMLDVKGSGNICEILVGVCCICQRLMLQSGCGVLCTCTEGRGHSKVCGACGISGA